MIFFDASAIAKAYLTENGSTEIRLAILEMEGRLYLTRHVVLEVLSAFAKMLRRGELNRSLYRGARRAFLAEVNTLNVLEVESPVFIAANALVDHHRRIAAGAMDVLHVATALRLQSTTSSRRPVVVASSDHAFLSLARAAGLPTFDPETESFNQFRARLG